MSDRRAIAGLIGAVLLFGILVISLSLYQAQVVPSENQRAEFEHSQQVQNQLEDVRNAILRTAWSGNSQPTSVTLGTRYPSRTVAVNPPPATGQLATAELPGNSTIVVSNVYAASGPEGLQQYLNNENNKNTLTYPTSALVYTPDYNEYRGAPRTVYENTLLYNNFTSGGEPRSLPLTDDSLVSASGDRVSLVVLRGDYSENGIGSATVDPESVSTPSGGVYVNGSLNVSLPTRYNGNGTGTTWNDLLPADASESGGRVNVSMTNVTLRIGAVNVGPNGETAHAAYLTQVAGGPDSFTVQAHDQYLNPYAGAKVTADGPVNRTSRTTGADGTATFRYTGDGTETVTVSIGGGRWNQTTYEPSSPTTQPPNQGTDSGVSYNDDAISQKGGNTVSFSVSAGSNDVEITGISVNTSAADVLHERSRGNGNHEIVLTSGSDVGYYDSGDGNTVDENAYQFGTKTTLVRPLAVSAGENATITLQRFKTRNSFPWASYYGQADMQYESLDVALYFRDSSPKTINMTVA